MTQTLHKETIEAIVTDKYLGAKNFKWDDTTLSFDFDTKRDSVSEEEYEAIINSQQLKILELSACIRQSEKSLRILCDEISCGGINEQ